MNGSDFRGSDVSDSSERARGGIPPRPASPTASNWRESQSMPAAPEASESHRVAVAPPPPRTSSGWLREPALDPRRLMPPPRHDHAPQRSFSPAPSRSEPSGPPVDRLRNGSPARPPEPARSSSAPSPNHRPARFTERPVPPENNDPRENIEPSKSFTHSSASSQFGSEPQTKSTASPVPLERKPHPAQPPRSAAPTSSEPSGRQASEPEAKASAAPPAEAENEPFEIEPARPMVPPLWERLRDRTPLFRSESKRSQQREPDMAPHRFIAPAPVDLEPPEPAVSHEAARSAAPPPVQREPEALPQRFIAPAPFARTPDSAPQSTSPLKSAPVPPPAVAGSESAPRSIAPLPSIQEAASEPERPLPPLARHEPAPPVFEPERRFEPAHFEPNPPLEVPRGFSALQQDESQPTAPQSFEPEIPRPATRTPSAPAPPPAWLSDSSQDDEPQWSVESPLQPEADPAAPRFATPPPAERAPQRPPVSRAPMRTLPPHSFELQEDIEPPRAAAAPVSDHFAEPALPLPAESWRNVIPPSTSPAPSVISDNGVDFAYPRSAPSASDELFGGLPQQAAPQQAAPQLASWMRRAMSTPALESEPLESDTRPVSRPVSPPTMEHSRHWSALFEETSDRKRIELDMDSKRAAPSDRKPSPTPEPAVDPPALDPLEPFRTAAPPASERPRDRAPLFAAEPWRSSSSSLHEMESAPEWPHGADSQSFQPEPDLRHNQIEAAEEDDSVEPRDPVFPKLLKRLATVGRAALPIVPHVLPRDGAIGATVSAVTAVSSALAGRAALQNAPQSASSPKIDLAPIGDNIDILRLAHKELRDKVVDQCAVLERVQDQVDMLCEAANRVESEQRDLVDELKLFSRWALVFAVGASVLLMATIAFEVVLFFR